MKKSSQRTVLGVIVCCVLATLLLAQWWSLGRIEPPKGERVALAASSETGATGSVPEYSIPEPGRFQNMVERTLFNPERRVKPSEGGGSSSGDVGIPEFDNLHLDAIIVDGGRRAALLRMRGQRQQRGRWVDQGEEFQGWTVDRVHTDRIRLVRGERAVTVILRPFRRDPDQESRNAHAEYEED